jgi:hypothetical protein
MLVTMLIFLNDTSIDFGDDIILIPQQFHKPPLAFLHNFLNFLLLNFLIPINHT